MTAAGRGEPGQQERGQDERCAVLARAFDEPVAGTAPVVPRWLCLEEPGDRADWPRDLGRHPDPAVAAFAARATDAGFRPLLVRRPGPGTPDPARRVFLTDTDPAAARTTTLTVANPAELAEVPLPEPGPALPGTPVTDPLLLVCTHAQRDPCCGTEGRALVDALAAAGHPGVWECGHLGGHRFAPTALVLPTGYLYGLLDAPTAVAVLDAAAAGDVLTECCRGRSTWTPEGQVAELAVRAATGLRAAAALTVRADTAGPVQVGDRSGAGWSVEVSALDSEVVRPASCGVRPTLMVPLRAGPVRPAADHQA